MRTTMRIIFATALLCASLWATILGPIPHPAGAAEPPASPQPQSQLKQWIKMEWSLGPDLPQGFQDSDGGVLGSQLITSCGFCSGGLEEDNRRKPGRYPRGFLTKTWALDLEEKSSQWMSLPDFPGAARQGLFSAVVGESLYFWGGFSYSEPFCYSDGYRLRREGDGWRWDRLPDLPSLTTSAALCAVGSKIYCGGGADYDGVTGFFTEHDRAKQQPRRGSRLLVLDTERLGDGWKSLPECPGTPRFVHTFQQVGGKLYLIGGATGDVVREGQRYGTCTVVDNWRFDPATGTWTRLRDLPVSSGNFPKSSQLVFRDRFIVLPGGHQYSHVANPDGSVRAPYGKASQKRPASGLHNDLFVYDTQTDQFGTGDPLPIDNNLPMSVIRGDRLYLIGGETGGGEIDGRYFGHHPDLLLIGKMKLAAEVAADPSQSKSPATQRGVIVAASDASTAAQRLKTLIAQDAGLTFSIISPEQKHDAGDLQFVLCTKASRFEVKHLLPTAALSADFKPQGFLISTDSQSTQAVVIGGDTDGLRYGVGELWHYRCALDGKTIVPQKSLSIVKAPAFSKRMFWNWTHCTN